MKHKVTIVHVVFLFCWCLLVGRAIDLQLMPHPKLEARIQKQFLRTITVQSKRGNIFDKNGKVLATSILAQSVFVDPSLVKSPNSLSRDLSRILGINKTSVQKKVRKKNRFVWIKRKISDREYQKLRKLKYKGLAFIEEYKRVYPNKNTLASILGFTNIDGKGLSGLELEYDDLLKGEPVKLNILRDGKGRPLIFSNTNVLRKNSGSDVYLNIDIETQSFFENALLESMRKSEASRAWGILMEADTGAIVSSVQLPRFDVNKAASVNVNLRKNILGSEVHEMGSVIKTFSFLGAMDKLNLKPTHEVKCHVKGYQIGRRKIRDSHEEECERISLIDAFSKSLNTVSSELAIRLGEKKLTRFFKSFGFNKKTGVDFPGEAKPIFYNKLSGKHHLASISFGHGMSLNTYQVARAYGVLANGGYLVRPHYLKYSKKNFKKENQFKVKRKQVLSPDQAFMGRMLLSSVVSEDATAPLAAVPGYLVGGKTGTAQKVDLQNGGYSKEVLSSFAGVFPISKPKYVVYILVDSPKSPRSGGVVAAPVFAKLANFVLQKERIAPDNIIPSQVRPLAGLSFNKGIRKNSLSKKSEFSVMPDLKGFSLREVLSQIKKSDLKVKFEGSGKVVKTVPSTGEPVPSSKLVRIVLR